MLNFCQRVDDDEEKELFNKIGTCPLSASCGVRAEELAGTVANDTFTGALTPAAPWPLLA
jgi:hypothetical protein